MHIARKRKKAGTKIKRKRKPYKLPTERVPLLSALADLYGPTVYEDRSILRAHGLKKPGPKTLKKLRQIEFDRNESVLKLIARMNGTYNGKRVYLTETGEPTYIHPEQRKEAFKIRTKKKFTIARKEKFKIGRKEIKHKIKARKKK